MSPDRAGYLGSVLQLVRFHHSLQLGTVMKFGRQFREQQNPAWLHAYVKYDRSKALIKALTNKTPDEHRHVNIESRWPTMSKRSTNNRLTLDSTYYRSAR